MSLGSRSESVTVPDRECCTGDDIAAKATSTCGGAGTHEWWSMRGNMSGSVMIGSLTVAVIQAS